jgi:hypothetical protein
MNSNNNKISMMNQLDLTIKNSNLYKDAMDEIGCSWGDYKMYNIDEEDINPDNMYNILEDFVEDTLEDRRDNGHIAFSLDKVDIKELMLLQKWVCMRLDMVKQQEEREEVFELDTLEHQVFKFILEDFRGFDEDWEEKDDDDDEE